MPFHALKLNWKQWTVVAKTWNGEVFLTKAIHPTIPLHHTNAAVSTVELVGECKNWTQTWSLPSQRSGIGKTLGLQLLVPNELPVRHGWTLLERERMDVGCVCVCARACTCACAYTYACVYIYVCVCVNIRVLSACGHAHISWCTHTACTHACIYMNTCMPKCMQCTHLCRFPTSTFARLSTALPKYAQRHLASVGEINC